MQTFWLIKWRRKLHTIDWRKSQGSTENKGWRLEHKTLKYASVCFVFLCLYCDFLITACDVFFTLQWRHNGHDSVSNHQSHDCLLNRYSDANQWKHQTSASLAFVRGIHRGPLNSPYKWPVTRKMFPFDDVIMTLVGVTSPVMRQWHDCMKIFVRASP